MPKLSPEERKAYERKRNERWRHYGLFGSIRFFEPSLNWLATYHSVADVRNAAMKVQLALDELKKELTENAPH